MEDEEQNGAVPLALDRLAPAPSGTGVRRATLSELTHLFLAIADDSSLNELVCPNLISLELASDMIRVTRLERFLGLARSLQDLVLRDIPLRCFSRPAAVAALTQIELWDLDWLTIEDVIAYVIALAGTTGPPLHKCVIVGASFSVDDLKHAVGALDSGCLVGCAADDCGTGTDDEDDDDGHDPSGLAADSIEFGNGDPG